MKREDLNIFVAEYDKLCRKYNMRISYCCYATVMEFDEDDHQNTLEDLKDRICE